MVTDVFTNSSKRRDSYRYLGLRQANNNTSTGALRDATNAAILECFRASREEPLLRSVLEALGGKRIYASFETARPQTRRVEASKIIRDFISSLEEDEERRHATPDDALLSALGEFNAMARGSERRFDLGATELRAFWEICRRFKLEVMDLQRLLKRLGFASVRIHIAFGNRISDLEELSTGQLLLLSMCARIAAHIQPNSLVIIDEPEAGLHPNWQSAFIPLMRSTIPSSNACHFIIATHSPYLVSDADDVLMPSDHWGTFVPFDEPYQGRSIENVLYRVFNARVAGNLMVEGDLRTLVKVISNDSSVSTVEQLNEARNALRRLQSLQGEDTKDLNRIIDQAEALLS